MERTDSEAGLQMGPEESGLAGSLQAGVTSEAEVGRMKPLTF